MSKIIDKINARRQKYRRGGGGGAGGDDAASPPSSSSFPPGWYHSFEYFPPKTEPGLDNLLTRIDRMARRLDPLFVDVTWGDSGSTAARTLAVASHAQRYCGVDVLMHVTCMGLTKADIKRYLDQARSNGVRNVLALRGDPPRGKRSWEVGDVSTGECPRAVDLVKLIRELHGDYFGIAVAGHPEGHPSSSSPEQELVHLKEKVDAGADLIVTQFFYDPEVFLSYVRRCRAAGILCPILPGIMPVQSYGSLVRMTDFCGISVPPSVLERLEPVKDDDEAVKRIGWEIATQMCRRILSATEEEGGVDGVHFYTLNLERSVTRILIELGAVQCVEDPGKRGSYSKLKVQPAGSGSTAANGAIPIQPSEENARAQNGTAGGGVDILSSSPGAHSPILPTSRPFPWRPSALADRSSREDVRPINWANRPQSYVRRTEDWDEFPNGRWGDSTSPAFGELSDVGHFVGVADTGSEEDRREMMGGNSLSTEQDVREVFAKYVEGTVPHIPWCETPLQPESFVIRSRLAALNRAGFLTVNSQPPVDGADSSHPVFGWGGSGGRVYQKAYCECFVSRADANRLVEMVRRNPSMELYAVDNFGNELREGGHMAENRAGVSADVGRLSAPRDTSTDRV